VRIVFVHGALVRDGASQAAAWQAIPSAALVAAS